MGIDQKTPIASVDGTPVKHVIYSIISDYDMKTGLCELVDNAVDQWSDKKFAGNLTVELNLEIDRQIIFVRDNAGGVPVDDLALLIAPGKSRNDPGAEVIGIFGVGGKRSVIALAENTEIKTRFGDQQTHELDITPDWLSAPTWQIPAYAIPDIDPNTTLVKLSCLRRTFAEADVDALRVHLGQTYDWFINKACVIKLNGEPVAPINFEEWAYPPDFSPRRSKFSFNVDGAGRFTCEITSGLIRDRIPEESNYGVYFYCNHRLIQKEVKSRDVGYYVTTEAGVPHADSSLCRTIVRLDGPAKSMPWTSNKSQLNYDHPVFKALSRAVIDLTAHFSKLSRRLKDDWRGSVLRYDTGNIVVTETTDTATGTRLILPDLPKQSRPHGTRQKEK